jgi:hypothetical protein
VELTLRFPVSLRDEGGCADNLPATAWLANFRGRSSNWENTKPGRSVWSALALAPLFRCNDIESLNTDAGNINSRLLVAGDILITMNVEVIKTRSARILLPIGVIAMIVGALDPLEGSIVILAGSGLAALGTWLAHQEKGLAIYRTWLFGMIAFGVIAMFVMSAMGGIGGATGRSMWWALVLLPYPVGWLLSIANLIARGIDRVRHHQLT